MVADFFSSGVAKLNLFDDNRMGAKSGALMEMIMRPSASVAARMISRESLVGVIRVTEA